MIRFRDGKPIGIYYSQHSDGSAYDWDDTALTMNEERVCLRGSVCEEEIRSDMDSSPLYTAHMAPTRTGHLLGRLTATHPPVI